MRVIKGIVIAVPVVIAGLAGSVVVQAAYTPEVKIEGQDGYRSITSSGIPFHAVGRPDAGTSHRIASQDSQPRRPFFSKPVAGTYQDQRSGGAVNGVLFDPGTADRWHGNFRLTEHGPSVQPQFRVASDESLEQGPGGMDDPGGNQRGFGDGPRRPGGGPPRGMVPGGILTQYLGLTGEQRQKLGDLMKAMDALGRENFAVPSFARLRLTPGQIHRLAAGVAVGTVLTADQKQILDANKQPAFDGPGGDPGGPGAVETPSGLMGDARPPVADGRLPEGVTRVPVVFSGGYNTDPRDRGRPVALIAGALGVPSEIFRAAFTHVHPAPAGSEPEEGQVRQNKSALMSALGPYGVTDDRLNAVSNYYRYVRSRGEMWPVKPASAFALVKSGVVVGYEVTDGGSGYSSPPTVSVPGARGGPVVTRLSFGQSLGSNGAVAAITTLTH